MDSSNQTSKQAIYQTLDREWRGVLASPLPWTSALVSLVALLKTHLSYASWVGFYENHDGHLWIGPYQGKLACLHLKPGQGVCGQSLAQRQTLIVTDVEKFPGHVACDALSRSEIVVPVFRARAPHDRDNALVGVLDLDSHELSAFDAVDQEWLKKFLKEIEHLP